MDLRRDVDAERQATTARWRRRRVTPARANPMIDSAHVAGSGTPVGSRFTSREMSSNAARGGCHPHLPPAPRTRIYRRGDRRRADASPTWSGPEGSSHNESRFGSSFGLHPPYFRPSPRKRGSRRFWCFPSVRHQVPEKTWVPAFAGMSGIGSAPRPSPGSA